MKVSDVIVKDRARNSAGEIDSLIRSIEMIGLSHPIIVDPKGVLLAGLRRLEAFRQMGREEIPHRVVSSIDDAMKALVAERDENMERRDFTPLEASELGSLGWLRTNRRTCSSPQCSKAFLRVLTSIRHR